MPKIYFTSGKTLEITDFEFERIAPKLQMGGIRLYRTGAGNLIPLNSTTMELIEKESTEDAFVDEEMEVKERVTEAVDKKVEEIKERDTEKEEGNEEAESREESEDKVEEVKETSEQRNDRLLEEMKEKAACLHEGKQKMYYQATKAGNRYFPVCEFCGKRERYISVKKIKDGLITDWTMDDLMAAKEYQEK
jgi:flagellar biosynthesis GTPase FlhF